MDGDNRRGEAIAGMDGRARASLASGYADNAPGQRAVGGGSGNGGRAGAQEGGFGRRSDHVSS